LVTTKTIDDNKQINNIEVEYMPSAVYAYNLGKNILEHKKI
jgi:hypothetical protein